MAEMRPNIRSFHEGDTSRTVVDSAYPTLTPPMTTIDQSQAVLRYNQPQPIDLPRPGRMQVRRGIQAPRQQAVRGMNQGQSMVMPEMTRRGAATRPVGLGAQMIPGMAEDPRLLERDLRPQGSSFQNMAGPSMAGLTDDMQQKRLPDSNAGFDYLPASEQARFLQSLSRSR